MARLGDVFPLIRNGASIKQIDGAGGLPVTRIETIANRVVDRSRMGYANIIDKDRYTEYQLQDGDILMSHINSERHLGKVARYKSIANEYIIHGMNLLVLRVNRQIMMSEYAEYFFNSDSFLRQIPNITKKSVNQASFNISSLRELFIPIPQLDQQREVVYILDEVCALISLRKQQLAKLDELVKSRFIELFGDSEQNPRGLPVLPWSEVFLTTTGKLDANAMVDNGQYPFFTCAKESFWIDTYAFDCEALLLAGNNAAGIYDVKHYKGKFNAYQRTYVLCLMNEQWSYELFKCQLEDKLLYLQSQSKGTNTRYLTLGILNELRFVVPPIDEQDRFTTFVKQTDKSKLSIQQSIDQLETLKKSLMQKYFG